jgi:hypothetical protein
MRSAPVRGLLWAAAGLILAWGLLDPRFRDTEGTLQGIAGLLFALAASSGVVAAAWSESWRRFGLWIAVALVGQAVALQLVLAGSGVGYQHYQSPMAHPATLRAVLVGWLAVQTSLVAGGLSSRWPSIRQWCGRSFRPWQLLAIGALFALSSATFSRSLLAFTSELMFATFLQALGLGTIILAVWSIPDRALDSSRLGILSNFVFRNQAPTQGRARMDRLAILAAGWTLAVSLTLAIVAYQRHPHVPDEVAYLFQARSFAEGMLWLPPPPVPGAFSVDLLYFGADKVYSVFPPGWPAVLALGVLIGAPWVVNPVLAALNVLLAFVLLDRLYDRRSARIGAVLMACSPWSLFLAMSYMAHHFTLTCALAAALGVVATRRSGRVRWAWLAGVAIGVISLLRPLDALVVAGLLGLWSVGVGGTRLPIKAIVGMVAAAVAVGLGNLWYNTLLTGSARVFPVMEYFDAYYGPKTNALGFGPERGVGWSGLDPFPGHGLIDVGVNANFNLFATNIELFGWCTGSLFLVFLIVFSRRMNRSDRLLLASGLAVVGIHTFYWFSGGPDFGARYWYLILVPCIGLTARGVTVLADLLGTRSSHARVSLGVLALSIIAMVTFVPWRAIDKYYHYRGMRPDIASLARTADFGRSVVLIQGKRHPDYHSAAVHNPLGLQANAPIYAWDRTPEVRDSILLRYPNRLVWVVAGPSRTGGAYRILQGPLPAAELAPER